MVFDLLSKFTDEVRNKLFIEIEKNEENNQSEDILVFK